MPSRDFILRVTYLELLEQPPAFTGHEGPEQIRLENLPLQAYLALYRQVGESLSWDQRLQMPEPYLAALLEEGCLKIHVLRDAEGHPLGFCEFDHSDFPQVELKNFGLVPEARGKGLGPRLLSVALHREWECRPNRIWLHTDTWDHPSAVTVYQRAGLRVYAVREEAAGPL